jgi:YggT family protein
MRIEAGTRLMQLVITIIVQLLEIYKWVMFAMIIGSWLIAYNVINRHNQFVDAVWRTLVIVTEPVLKPIRQILPRTPLDLSPIVVFIGIWIIQFVLMSVF